MPVQLQNAQNAIDSLDRPSISRYEHYFDSLVPTSTEDRFRRWIFAFASVHTGWKANCAMYEALAPLDWIGNDELLRRRIIDSRAGMHNHRTRYISTFSDTFWSDHAWFQKDPCESWTECMDRIVKRVLGLGRAKVSFALELIYFQHAHVVCADTHFCQMYGITPKQYGAGKVKRSDFDTMEQHWISSCSHANVSCVTARWLTFDMKQGHDSPTYWSYVLE